MEHQSFLTDISISIIAAGIISVILRKLKQPLILGYILAGIILGPGIGFGIITNQENILLISEIGLIFLLFIIGLDINISEMISAGKNILVLSCSQIVLGFFLNYLFLNYLFPQLSPIETVYLSSALNITSTLIVVKLLNDKFEVPTLPGKLTIGVLIFQDFFAILFLAFQKDFINPQYSVILNSFLIGILLLSVSYLFSKYVISEIIHKNSDNTELILIITIAYCFLVSTVANILGLSKEMGALIAGISISNSPYSEEISLRISSIRDFFVTLFFVALGLQIPALNISYLKIPLLLMLVIIISRFLSVLYLNFVLKTGIRPLFITALNLIPVSEFSLVIVSLGLKYGHITKELQILIIMTMIISSIISTYIINYNHEIYKLFSKIFNFFEERESQPVHETDMLILGYNKNARELIKVAKEKFGENYRITVADFNVANKKEVEKYNADWVFVDLSSYDSIKKLEKYNPKIVISLLQNIALKGTNNIHLLSMVKSIFRKSKVIFLGEDSEEEEKIKELGSKSVNYSKLISNKVIRDIRLMDRKEKKKLKEQAEKENSQSEEVISD